MKKLAVFFLSLIFVLSACNSNNSKERITKENIKIDPKDSHYVIKENSENKPQKIKVYKINKDGKEDITNNGVT
ncbi:TPA: lipoprotein, partial [Staphylococcus aureus]|nr:lipoprotein [Staphylococcus aureus]